MDVNKFFQDFKSSLSMKDKSYFPNTRDTPAKQATYQFITNGLSKRELAEFNSLGVSREFEAGQLIFNEADESDNLYIIVSGEAEIFKQSVDENQVVHDHVLATLKFEDVLGDMALIENKPRSASCRAKTHLRLSSFQLKDLQAHPQINAILIKNIAVILSSRLRYTNEITIKSMKESLKEAQGRNALGIFMIALFWLMCLYTLSLRGLAALTSMFSSATPLTVGLIFIYSIVIIKAMRLTGLSYARFGITWKNGGKKTIEALLYTVPLMVIFLILKVIYIHWGANPAHVQIFSGAQEKTLNGVFSWPYYFTLVTLYTVFSPVQELLARSAMQTTFFLYLPGSVVIRRWNAIILANLLFSTVHSHLSLSFAAISFIPGLFWGWLFDKQRSLVGVSVSHIVLGLWTVFILGAKGWLYP